MQEQANISATLEGQLRTRRRFEGVRRFFRTKPLGVVSLIILLVVVFMAVFADLIAPYGQNDQLGRALLFPSSAHWMGTDELGRDLLTRIIFGARISLEVGLIVVFLGTLNGSFWGVLSGYFGGWVDHLVQRVMDALMAIPLLVLALAIVATLGPSITNVILALAVASTPRSNRVVRGTVVSVKQNQYIDAARAVGCSDRRILFLHILPNAIAPIIVIASVTLGGVIIAEASLSFLGLGTPPPTPSWGGMLSQSGRSNLENAPWLAVFPGIAISLTVLAFNLFGDALRDILDPRLRQ